MDRVKVAACGALALLAVLGAYANHFHNGFHFDDVHAVLGNGYIQDLRNIPRFFIDGTTFSSLPTNQSYRPLITATLAVDYRLAKGPNPFWFQVDTFFWYIVMLGAMFFFFLRLMQAAVPSPRNGYIAIFATALFGLHPVCAQTVNYVVQRGEVHSTLGVVLAFVMWQYLPQWRKWGLYLLPVVVGSLSKPPALMFCPMLVAYVYLFESDPEAKAGGRAWKAVRAAIPAAVVFVLMAAWQEALTPKTSTLGGTSAFLYWITQPSVILHYLKEFFLPTDLKIDTDRDLASGIFSETLVLSLGMITLLLAWIWPRLRRPEMRPFSFGLCWFVLALAPTSIPSMAEVENDHRMFFPFVGLTLALVWAASQTPWLERRPRLAAAGALVALAACAWGTRQRNVVWSSDESLWREVTLKSPRSGRGWMQYGTIQLAKGDIAGALATFQQAEPFAPKYALLHVNLGIANGLLGNQAEAEAEFHRAMILAPQDAQVDFYYGRYVGTQGRVTEAIELLRKSIALNDAYKDPRYLLMQIYAAQGDTANLQALEQDTLRVFGSDPFTAELARETRPPDPNAAKTPEYYLTESLKYELAGKHEECIAAAREALKLRPGFAEAYNNIAAAEQSMGHWDAAIQAAQEAIRLKPDFQLARNNLQWELSQKALAEKAK